MESWKYHKIVVENFERDLHILATEIHLAQVFL